ncbi:tetratricopeptide repeat protein [Pseudofulvimonas gallinarii]|jgi:tetratricopeptide (TPR) repeat protein|uniref:Uncharacterized protein HemY n=1 Tax=Pseudofulvimonas gallinarii TaxID=634155 RepID=A0A4V2UUX4_9GAMM|nr:tetratricopeptide repeat protein [Pseudofulvimonas gallinarii]TCS93537.1 uncharacterized protein HemY [Pseudofulvimonas gallinarii]
MKRLILAITLVSLPLTALLTAQSADAQSRSRESRQRTTQKAEENQYPNTSRAEPDRKTNERSMRRIQTAYTALNEGEYDKVTSILGELDGNARLTAYEQGLVNQGLAQAAYEQDDVETALVHWQKAVDGGGMPNNQHFQLMYQIAQLQLMEEHYDAALATVDRWLRESGSTKPEAYGLKGNALYRLERYDEAVAALDQAIGASGDSPANGLFELKMAALYEKQDYLGASQVLEELVRRRPDEVKYQINLAQTYIELEQLEKALPVMQNLRSSGKLKDTEHWRQLYQLQAYADRPADAAATITDGIQAGALPADKDTLRALGDNYYQAEMIDQAIDAYTRSAAASPDDGNADQQRGHLLLERERNAEAREALATAMRKGNLRDPGTAYLLIGELEAEAGNNQAAIAAFREALKHDRSRGNAELWLKNLGAR